MVAGFVSGLVSGMVAGLMAGMVAGLVAGMVAGLVFWDGGWVGGWDGGWVVCWNDISQLTTLTNSEAQNAHNKIIVTDYSQDCSMSPIYGLIAMYTHHCFCKVNNNILCRRSPKAIDHAPTCVGGAT